MVSVFGPGNLRESQDWVGNEWVFVRERPDLVASVLSSLKTKQNSNNSQSTGATTRDVIQSGQSDTCLDSDKDRPRKPEVVPDLLKNVLLSQLRWKTTRKRKRGRSSASYQKPRCTDTHQKRSPNVMKSNAPDSFLIPASLKVDHDDCKYVGDPSIFSSSVVPSLTNMVMCR